MKKTLREWRKEKGLTIAYVSSQLGLSPFSLNAKERGERQFTMRQLKILCDLYSISLKDINFI